MPLKAHVVVISYAVLLVLSIILTYLLASLQHHVDYFVPYIGFLGTHHVESAFFTQLFVIIAALAALIVQIQYVWVRVIVIPKDTFRFQADTVKIAKKLKINTISMAFGYISAAALFVTACFPDTYVSHFYTAMDFLYLIATQIYFLLQTIISKGENHPLAVMRLVLNILMLLSFLSFTGCYAASLISYTKTWTDRYRWGKNDGGWIPYLLSSTSQWILIILFQIYILTLIPDFKFIQLTQTAIVVLDKNP